MCASAACQDDRKFWSASCTKWRPPREQRGQFTHSARGRAACGILVWERMHLVIGCEHYTRLQLQPASGSGAPAAKTGSISLASGFTQPTAASGRQPHGYCASQHTVHTRRFAHPPHSSPALSRLCPPLPVPFFFRVMTADKC